MKIFGSIVSVVCLILIFPALANPLSGDKIISLVTMDGTAKAVGKVYFSPNGSSSSYKITWDDAPFTNHFLSMRPFRCLKGPDKNWCYVPYPYENKHKVTAEDLTDLEYDLLFLWKKSNDYGINMWNGVYYKLEIDGDRIIGRLHEMDMDVLSAPPPAGELRPVQNKHIHKSEPESHWLPVVVIE